MAAMVCVRTDEELDEIFIPALAHRIHSLSQGWPILIRQFLATGALISDEFFREQAEWFTKGHMTFLEAHRLTGRILNVSVMSDEGHSKTKVIHSRRINILDFELYQLSSYYYSIGCSCFCSRSWLASTMSTTHEE